MTVAFVAFDTNANAGTASIPHTHSSTSVTTNERTRTRRGRRPPRRSDLPRLRASAGRPPINTPAPMPCALPSPPRAPNPARRSHTPDHSATPRRIAEIEEQPSRRGSDQPYQVPDPRSVPSPIATTTRSPRPPRGSARPSASMGPNTAGSDDVDEVEPRPYPGCTGSTTTDCTAIATTRHTSSSRTAFYAAKRPTPSGWNPITRASIRPRAVQTSIGAQTITLRTALAVGSRRQRDSVGEHSAQVVVPYKQEVVGSIPAAPTTTLPVRSRLRTTLSAPVSAARRNTSYACSMSSSSK